MARPRHRLASRHLLGAALLVAASQLRGADIFHSNTPDAANLTTAWTGGVVPGSGDVAVWDSTVTAANTTALGASLTWGGIRIANPAGTVTISNTAGATLSLGSGGIDMSAATQNLTLGANLALVANQIWTVAGGRTLTGIAGASTSSGSGTGNLSLQQSGTGVALVVFNQNGNAGSGQTGWSSYSGNLTIGPNVKVQSQGNAAIALGSGTVTLAGGALHQNSGTWII